MPTRHPALHADYGPAHSFASSEEEARAGGHFVPEGWESANVGACPCGELVRWDDETERWTPDRSLVALILPADVADLVRSSIEDLQAGDPDAEAENAAALDLLRVELSINRWVDDEPEAAMA